MLAEVDATTYDVASCRSMWINMCAFTVHEIGTYCQRWVHTGYPLCVQGRTSHHPHDSPMTASPNPVDEKDEHQVKRI